MIVSRRGPRWAAAHLLLLLFGGGADAAAAPRLEGRQGQSQPISATATDVAPSSATGYFQTQWTALNGSYDVSDEIKARYTVTEENPTVSFAGNLNWMLLWTNATSGTPDSTNTYIVAESFYICDTIVNTKTCSYQMEKTGNVDLNLTVDTSQIPPSSSDGVISNFFFCLANVQVCETFSSFFSLNIRSQNARQLQERQSPLTIPTAVLSVPNTWPFLKVAGSSSLSSTTPTVSTSSAASTSAVTTSSSGITSIFVTVSMSTTGTTTISAPSDSSTSPPSSNNGSSKSSHKGLPTGAIIGIAIGGFIILLIAALLIFFCYRRRRRQQTTTPEQVMLTHNMNTSRDLMAEKHNSYAATMLTGSILETRPTSDYDHISSSAPYHGRVGPHSHLPATTPPPMSALPPTPIPQRNPTAATSRTNLSRNVSDASGPIIPRSLMEGEQYDAYHDNQDHDDPSPVYGDARHVAQVYQAPAQVQAPFLSEPGMTDEELTRLEEEERRIDAAILEAERRRDR